MQVKSLVLGAAVALHATAAAAENPKPRIYFPRHVKRQFTNTTLTSRETFPPPESTPFDSRSESRNFITSFRATVSDLLSSEEGDLSTSTSSEGASSGGSVTTIIISSTVRVSPTSQTTAPELPPPVVISSSSSAVSETDNESTAPESSQETTRDTAQETTQTSQQSTQETSQESTDETTTESTPEPSTEEAVTSSENNSSTGGIPPIIVLPTESTESDEPETETTTSSSTVGSTTSTAPVEQDTTSSSPSSPIVIAPTGVVTSSAPATTSSTLVEATTAESSNTTEPVSDLPETTSTTRLLDPIISPIQSIVSAIVPSVPANDTEAIETTTDLSEPTSIVESPTSSGGLDVTQIIPSLTSLPSILEPTVSANGTESELPAETSTPSVEVSVTSLPPTETSLAPSTPPEESPVPGNSTTSDLPLPSASESGSVTVLPSVSATESAIESATEEPSVLPSESGIIGNETSIIDEPSVAPTELPQTSSVPTNTSDLVDEPSSTVAPVLPSETSVADAPSTPVSVSTVEATTLTVPTQSWMPTTIIVEQSTPTVGPTVSGSTPTTTVTMPSDLPRLISPDDGDTERPDGTMLLQVGFLWAENYEHVSNHPMAAAQIFAYLPVALAHAADIDGSKIKVIRLVPFDTTASLGYITTLARFYYPETLLDKLRMDVKIHNSALYNNPEELVYNLTSQINSAIDIIPGQESEPGVNGGDGGDSSSPDGNNDILSNNESESTPIQKGTAAAIGIGAFGVAAAYGAAMFLVARRYKQKKQAHRRSSSIANSSEMRYTGNGSPAMMGGALLSRDFTGYGGLAGGRDSHGSGRSGAGNSVRTAQISAPVAAENSLGWN